MFFSKRLQYGLRVVLYLIQKKEEGYVSTKTITQQLDLPFHYVSKILRQLSQHGLTESRCGPNGGIKLNPASREVTIRELIEMLEGEEIFETCILGVAACGGPERCMVEEEMEPCGISQFEHQLETPVSNWARQIPTHMI